MAHPMGNPRLLVALALGLTGSPLGCEDGRPPPEPPAIPAPPNPPKKLAPAAEQPELKPRPAAPAAVSAVAAVAKAGIGGLLAAEPTTEMKRTKGYLLNHEERIGVYFGLPPGWRNDDLSFLSAYSRTAQAGGRFVALRLGEPGLGKSNEQRVLERGPQATMLLDPSWQEWHDGVAGRKRWVARIARGSGQPLVKAHGKLRAIAAVIDVPGAKAVGVMGTWPEAQPDLEIVLADMIRHLHRCHVEVGRGCVPEGS